MSVIPYNTDTISNEIHTEWAGKTVHFAKEIDSTNEWCKRLSKEDAVHGTLAVAEFQSAGKGRLGRRWVVPEGNSIMMSILLRPDFEPRFASMLTLVMGLSVAQAVKELGVDVSIKWPNDVVVGGKKICGILTEMSSEGMDIKYAVVGIGINVSMMEFPEELADKATSIKLENGTGCDRSKLVASVANHFEELYDAFVKCQDLQFMLDEYNSILVNKDEQVYVIEGYNRTEYTALGLAPNGGLRVKDKDGQESIIISGEVSVRGIYGYV